MSTVQNFAEWSDFDSDGWSILGPLSQHCLGFVQNSKGVKAISIEVRS